MSAAKLGLLSEQAAADRNRREGEADVARQHESAPTRARTGSAAGVSSDPVKHALLHGGDRSIPMPPLESLKSFLREYYLHSRFEGRDGAVWGNDYSGVVTRSTMDELDGTGVACIGMYESNRGRVIWFDRALHVLNPDESPAQIQAAAGNLTHIYGQALS